VGWISALAIASLGLLVCAMLWTRRARRWGATPSELSTAAPGDEWSEEVPGAHVRMTRAISIQAPPGTVWRWLAQTGRGAGWFSYERLDNGGRASARHLVRWIPDPCVGDAAAIGYLRHLDPGRALVWWSPGLPFLGARTWSSWAYWVAPEGHGSRLLLRVNVAAVGPMRFLVMALFPTIDSIMAIRQLRTLRERAERYGARTENPEAPETGERDQYQLHHVIYASGEEAGVPGVENAREARGWATEAGVV
jgi:hypothetical protein